MADVDVMCPGCKQSVKLSEYAAFDTLVCRTCGAPLRLNAANAATSADQAPKLRLKRDTQTAEAPTTHAPAGTAFTQTMRAGQGGKPRRAIPWSYALSWVIMLLLAAVTGFFRYGRSLPLHAAFVTPDHLAVMAAAAPWVGLALHLMIVAAAFKDSVFQGIFSFLIPGYSLYYIVLASDRFVLRALTVGLLVGFGQDAALVYRDLAVEAYTRINAFLSSGGGDVRYPG